MRVVSLLPAATEMVCALGLGEALVGRSHECDEPPWVRALPACTSSKLELDGRSYAIDARVKATVQEGLSLYRVHAQDLRRLRPDVVITQTQCEVCAASVRDVEAALAQVTGSRPRMVALAPATLADVWADLERVADALGVAERGRELRRRLEGVMASVAERTRARPTRPRVAVIEWIDPLMAGGNWVPELVELAGGESVLGAAGAHSPWIEWDALVAADPDVIVVTPCGWDVARARAELGPLIGRPGWNDLKAVKAGRVYLADGNQYFNRPGPRLVESLELLAALVHPDAFTFGRDGVDWAKA